MVSIVLTAESKTNKKQYVLHTTFCCKTEGDTAYIYLLICVKGNRKEEP